MQAIAFLLALTLCTMLTPVARVVALKLNIVDYPNAKLKTHGRPVPYLGGAAVFISVAVTLCTLNYFLRFPAQQTGLLLGTLLIFILGLVDDMRAMSAYTKLIVQVLAAYVCWSYGIGFYSLEHWSLDLIVTLFWIVAVTNAFNLIDIMDGLAAGVGSISSLFLAWLFYFSGDSFNAACMLALAGSCLGFLVFNFKPAKIYMGDTGSLLIGFLLACTAAQWTEDQTLGIHSAVPLFILGVPLFELIFVSVLRLKAGKSPLQGSRDHFALRLVAMGFSVKRTVLLAYAGAILLGLMAVLIIFWHDMAYGLAGVTFVLIGIVAYQLSRVRVS